ncbi:MAG: hypothetical protein K0R65_2759 [Crocinitomicaceae bacterium]|jgi:antitoxin component YwqK of YwqJK toxin-antitoxin module|nr:hypothetical protein [Crocinitomicaceae bacterium]
MRKFTTIYFLFCVLLTANAQRINDAYHLKHNIRQDNQQFEFRVLDFGDKGVYQYDKSKFYFWLKAQQVHATQGYSSGLLLHGEFQAFYVNKQLSQRGYFYKGLKNGEWLYWNSEGTMTHLEHWRSGVKVGTEKSFSDEGVMLAQVKYKMFKTVRQTPDSTIVSYHKKNKQTITLHDAYGNKNQVIRRKNGQLHGKQVTYKEGKPELVEEYKNGQKVEEKAKEKKGDKESGNTGTAAGKKPFSERMKTIFRKSDKEKKDSKNKEKNTKTNQKPTERNTKKDAEKKEKKPLFPKKNNKS